MTATELGVELLDLAARGFERGRAVIGNVTGFAALNQHIADFEFGRGEQAKGSKAIAARHLAALGIENQQERQGTCSSGLALLNSHDARYQRSALRFAGQPHD